MAEPKRLTPDILVIGAGSGGLSVASGAVQMGASVVLLEGHRMGGDCLNFGCVPSKALIASAKAAHGQAHSAPFGVANVTPQVDYAAAMEHVAQAIATIEPHDSQERFETLGVTVIREYGEFLSPREVKAGDTIIKPRRIVIATGSSPLVPPIPGLDSVPYDTNETLFDRREKPDHLLIIGGGPIGVEMAQAHVRLGCKVTVIEGAKALGQDDPELAALVLDRLREEGLKAPLQVYRALETLTERGLAHRLESLNAFVACAGDDCHRSGVIGFAICENCGSVAEFSDFVLRQRLEGWADRQGFHPHETTIEMRGTCAACSVAA